MRFFCRIILMLLVLSPLCGDAQSKRPKIGLTLSGGGAKGLSHIGILKAIDSAGLKIDVVTGTSMGSIMGALYSAGYSGKQIESIARGIDWQRMFSNKPALDMINIHEKREFGNYALEIPFEKGKAKLYSGIIEGEEIWLRFGELFYPVHDIKDFRKFNIPFSCIATDAATGKPVVLSEGEIVRAIRSSMAIPSVFSAVQYGEAKLIDGGVVRNFPVRDARDLGADYVIGVNLSNGLLSADQLNSPIEMLLQIGFYKDAEDFERELKLCNLLIEPPLDNFSAASFGESDSLLLIGDATGKKYYPYFKRLADSLNTLYPAEPFVANRLPRTSNTILDGFEFEGLTDTQPKDFIGKLGLTVGKRYSGYDFSEAARKAFSSGNFRKIAFYLQTQEPGHSKLRCNVIEYPRTYLKLGLHYHTYSDMALITTLSARNFLFGRSKSFVKINWSQNFRGLVRYEQAIGKKQNWGARFSFYGEYFKYPLYRDFIQLNDYRSQYSSLDLKFYRLLKTSSMFGFGISREFLTLTPQIKPLQSFEGHNRYWNGYFFFQRNTLDIKVFPHSGTYIDLQAGIIFDQKPDYLFNPADESIASDSLNLNFSAYEQVKLKVWKFFPLSSKWTLLAQFNNGINFNYKFSYMNFYSVGGINDFIRNQITFSGLGENQVNTGSISSLLLGIQFEPVPNFLTTFRANAALYDFIDTPVSSLTERNFLSGYSFSGGYRSPIGPIEISVMYSDQAQAFRGNVNMGFTF